MRNAHAHYIGLGQLFFDTFARTSRTSATHLTVYYISEVLETTNEAMLRAHEGNWVSSKSSSKVRGQRVAERNQENNILPTVRGQGFAPQGLARPGSLQMSACSSAA